MYTKIVALRSIIPPTCLIGIIEVALQVPHQWPAFSRILAEAISGNGTALYDILLAMGAGDMVRSAVTCADNVPYSRVDRSNWPTPEGMVDLAIHALTKYSRRWGLASIPSEPDGGCEFWPINKLEDIADGTAAERFAGPWNVSSSCQIIVVALNPI